MHKACLHKHIQLSSRARANATRKGHTWSIGRSRCNAKLARTHPTEFGMSETLQSKKQCKASSKACGDPYASCKNEQQCHQGCRSRRRRESRQWSCDHRAGTRHDNFPAPATRNRTGTIHRIGARQECVLKTQFPTCAGHCFVSSSILPHFICMLDREPSDKSAMCSAVRRRLYGRKLRYLCCCDLLKARSVHTDMVSFHRYLYSISPLPAALQEPVVV